MADQELKFSIIICVYNTSSVYLSKCLDSVIGQDYVNIEIIVVDDGSDDPDTLSCLQKYETLHSGDKRFIVKRQTNAGKSMALNNGWATASGDYRAVIDSDDYYMTDTLFSDLSELLSESNADLCSIEYVDFFNDSELPKYKDGNLHRDKVYGKPADEAMKALLSAPRQVFSAAMGTKIIKAALMKEHNILAPKGLSGEDNYLTARIISHVKTIDRYNKVVHASRRSNIASMTSHGINSYKLADDILAQFDVLLTDEESVTNRNVLDFLASPYVYAMGKVISAKKHSPDEDIEKLEKKLQQYSYVLRFSSRTSVRMMGMIVRVFSVRFALSVLRIFLSLNRKHILSLKRKVD